VALPRTAIGSFSSAWISFSVTPWTWEAFSNSRVILAQLLSLSEPQSFLRPIFLTLTGKYSKPLSKSVLEMLSHFNLVKFWRGLSEP